MGEHVAGSAEHVNMLGVARGDVYIRGYMAPIGAQWLIARSSRTVRTVTPPPTQTKSPSEGLYVRTESGLWRRHRSYLAPIS